MGAGGVNFSRDGVGLLGGWHPQALAFDVIEASLVVAGSVWLLALAQPRLTSRAPVLAASARVAYAAFMLQVPVLLSLEIAARPIPWPPMVKAVLVGTLAVAASFGLGWLLVKCTQLGKSSERGSFTAR
jgi:hypothetical protein